LGWISSQRGPLLIRTAHFVYGKGIREIAREYGHSRKTVRKALKGMVPRYRRRGEPNAPVMAAYREVVDRWLIEDQERPKKQRHTAARIYHRLVEEHGFSGGESTVRRYVRLRRADLGLNHVEAMVPLVHDVESGAEVDWGEAQGRIGGRLQKVKMFCMRSRYSGKIFVQVYPAERQEMFFDGHMRAFEFYGGVFREITYDNLTTAVKRILKGRRRDEQARFVQFRSFYTFESNFCARAKGNEKGGVEGLVGYARRNFMVPQPEFEDLEAMNRWLVGRCVQHGQRPKHPGGTVIDDLHDQQKAHLLANQKKPFENLRIAEGKVNKYEVVRVGGNMYSVPTRYVGRKVQVHLGCWWIRIFLEGREIACHRRDMRKNQWGLNPFHYLDALKHKTRAFDHAMPLKSWREAWPAFYEKFLSNLRRDRGERVGT